MRRPTRALSELGQSPWLDRITRDLLESGTLQRYVDQLSVTTPEKTLLAFADHGEPARPIPRNGGDAEHVVAAFTSARFHVAGRAEALQADGAASFVASWNSLVAAIKQKARSSPEGGAGG